MPIITPDDVDKAESLIRRLAEALQCDPIEKQILAAEQFMRFAAWPSWLNLVKEHGWFLPFGPLMGEKAEEVTHVIEWTAKFLKHGGKRHRDRLLQECLDQLGGVTGYLGLIVDYDKMTVRRKDCSAPPVDFTRKRRLWLAFLTLLKAEDNPEKADWTEYYAEFEKSGLRSAIGDLRSELRGLGIGIAKRNWYLVPNVSRI